MNPIITALTAVTPWPLFGAVNSLNGCTCNSKTLGRVAVQQQPAVPLTDKRVGCAAVYHPINEIYTDPRRFQNRVDAFSEASAERVAASFDPNRFDPIVVWQDKNDGRTYVLSGHSRLEGMKRRGAQWIAARFFQGSEPEAIQFARVYANRAATAESVLEDLTAYRLMKQGNEAKGIKAVKQAELNRTFPGKAAKLDAWIYLDPKGKFLTALSGPDRSEFPFIERTAMWAGELRRAYPDMTNVHERDLFHFLYAGGGLRLNKDELFTLVKNRLAAGKERIFPECNDSGCEKVRDWSEVGPNRELYRRLNQLVKNREQLSERLVSTRPEQKVWTPAEKEAIRQYAENLDNEIKQLRRDLKIVEREASLFGLGAVPRRTSYPLFWGCS